MIGMKEKSKNEILKIKEYVGIVIEIKGEDNAKIQREIIQKIFSTHGVIGIKYQIRSADRIVVVREPELRKYGLAIRG